MKILVADDEQLTRYTVISILESMAIEGLEIEEASNGKEVVERVKIFKPDGAFVDIRMPVIDGLSALNIVRKENEELYDGICWFILTGFADFEFARRAIDAGVVNYLLKPVSKNEMVRAVERIIELKKKYMMTHLQKQSTELREFLRGTTVEYSDDMPVLVKRTLKIVKERYKEPVGINEIADILKVTPNYLSAVFSRVMKISFTKFITLLKLEAAKELLLQDGTTVKSVAFEVGYSSGRHFTKVFRKTFLLSPTEFRKQNL